MNKPLQRALCSLSLILLIALGAGVSAPVVHADTTALSGYAWSSNIGWVDFSGVSVNPGGALSGYAWSDHIGWIQFGGLSGFPSGSGTTAANATISPFNDAMTGWARALTLAANDGDGWISLSGTGANGASYGVTYSASTGFSGYSWGSDDIGWMSWNFGGLTNPCVPTNGVCGPATGSPPIVTIAADGKYPNDTLATGHTTATLTWSATNMPANNPFGCNMVSSPSNTLGGPEASTSLGTVSGAIAGPTTFSLTCTNSSGSGSNSVLVSTTTAGGGGPGSTVLMWLDNDHAEALAAVHIHPSDNVILNWDASAFYNQYPPSDVPTCSGNVNTGQSVPSWTSSTSPIAQGQEAPDGSTNAITLSGLAIGRYSLDFTCSATVSGVHVASSSNPVTIVVTSSTIYER